MYSMILKVKFDYVPNILTKEHLYFRQVVLSANYLFGKTSVRQNIRRQNVRSAKCLSAKCLSAKCLSAKCPGTPTSSPSPKVWGTHTKQDVHVIIDAIYDEREGIWRRNLFMLPSGAVGKKFVSETIGTMMPSNSKTLP
jgi:hypothetical protein